MQQLFQLRQIDGMSSLLELGVMWKQWCDKEHSNGEVLLVHRATGAEG